MVDAIRSNIANLFEEELLQCLKHLYAAFTFVLVDVVLEDRAACVTEKAIH